MFTIWKKLLQDRHNPVEYNLESYQERLVQIKALSLSSQTMDSLSTRAFKLRQSGLSADELLIEAYAVAIEAVARILGLTLQDEQILAALALYEEKIIDMKTGEGKTVTAVLPAFLHALSGKGVHILTFNDYLARRDRDWMGPVFEFLGIRAGCVQEGMEAVQRCQAYQADVTYVTAREAAFDYLRDGLALDKNDIVHRPFHFAIIDEADSVLIDEARAPLVIAGELDHHEQIAKPLVQLIRSLRLEDDYCLDKQAQDVCFTDAGLLRLETALQCGNLYDDKNLQLLARLHCALFAEVMLQRDRDYLVRNGRIELLDEFTGRIAYRRNWPDLLQDAVAKKENLQSERGGTVLGSITMHNFLRLYPQTAGMSGTACGAAVELMELYRKAVVVIPTHQPCLRFDHADQIYTDAAAKTDAVVREIKNAYALGRPVLVAAGSVAESENLHRRIRREMIPCRLLNAKHDNLEAETIARAGEYGAVTISTNIAGRGVDILLGAKSDEDKAKVKSVGGLDVIGTTRFESSRIDDQLRGRSGRRGDPGESRFFISLEDDMLKRLELDSILPEEMLTAQSGLITDKRVCDAIAMVFRSVEAAGAETRRQLLTYQYLIEEQRKSIYAWREDILCERITAKEMYGKIPDSQGFAPAATAEDRQLEKLILLTVLDKHWSDYLQEISCLREGAHLALIGKQNPFDVFNRTAIAMYADMCERITNESKLALAKKDTLRSDLLKEQYARKKPSATWAILIDESQDQYSRLPELMKDTAFAIRGTLFSLRSFVAAMQKKFSRKFH